MKLFDTFSRDRTLDFEDAGTARSETARANRRRLTVFLVVLCLSSAVGLAYDFLRPPEYRATSRLQITPAKYVAPDDAATTIAIAPSDPQLPFLTEVEKLSSRPLLERVADRLSKTGLDLSALGPDPVAGLQSVLSVTPVPGTHVVELAATGARPELPAALLVAISEAYRSEIARSFQEHSAEAAARVDDEVRSLEAAVAAKRSEVEAFRTRYNIVSPEREENAALAQLQGLGKSFQSASDRLSAAQGKLSALRAAVSAGKGVVRAKDNPTLANLEQRASQTREDLHNLERNYTSDYLAIDPNARALRARLAAQEEQIKALRAASQQATLSQAEEELASAREAERRLRAQVAAGRQGVGRFAARFDQYKSLRSELEQLESAYRDALQRRARLEATERARVPSVQVLEQAALPREPWRPRYWRDAALVIAGALALALLAMAIVELFNRSEPRPAVVLAQPLVAGRMLQDASNTLDLEEGAAPAALGASARPLLERPASLPRELSVPEVVSLYRATDERTHLAMLLPLSGITPEEALELRWRDVEPEGNVVHVGGACARSVEVNGAAARCLASGVGAPDAPVLKGLGDQPATLESLSMQLLYAAHDAGLERPYEITPYALRHTYLAFLVRQGIRFADLAQLVGQLPAPVLAAYSGMAPAGARISRESVNCVFPDLDELEHD